jgi:GNAT superfamily N-acetyltransferase
LTVRLATMDDLDVVVQLRMALLREEAKRAILPRLRRDASLRARTIFAAELEGGHGATYLAFEGARAVGVLRCTISRNTQLVRPLRYAYLSWAWVQPGFRRRGVLRALVAAVEEWCRTRRLTEIRLRVTVDNGVGNASWAALGFAPEELVRRRAIARA